MVRVQWGTYENAGRCWAVEKLMNGISDDPKKSFLWGIQQKRHKNVVNIRYSFTYNSQGNTDFPNMTNHTTFPWPFMYSPGLFRSGNSGDKNCCQSSRHKIENQYTHLRTNWKLCVAPAPASPLLSAPPGPPSRRYEERSSPIVARGAPSAAMSIYMVTLRLIEWMGFNGTFSTNGQICCS